jgi:hypothetical protein
MRQPIISSEERYARIAETLLGLRGVSPSTMKGVASSGLMIDGKLFAVLRTGELLLKLPARRVELLIASGDGRRFDPGHGRAMKEWVTVKPTAREDWLALAREAIRVVFAQIPTAA